MTATGREIILERIRAALREPARAPATPHGAAAEPGGGSLGPGEVPREYRARGRMSRDAVLDLFAARVSDYRADVIRASVVSLPETVGEALTRRGVRRLVVPADLPDAWLPDMPGGSLEVLRDGEGGLHLAKTEMASCDGVLTGCTLGIAETGTIVLDSGPGQGRRALTLLPDYHLCVVRAEQVVETVPEAVRRLEVVLAGEGRPVTLVSGPSATSDIELVRVEGVHGPRNLEVILLEETS